MGKTKTPKERLEDCIRVHGNRYDYSKSKFMRAHDKIDIICSKHGLFNQKLDNHLQGKGCPSCYKDKNNNLGKYIDNGDGTATIPLTKGKHTIVSIEDIPMLIKYSWYFADGYAVRGDNGKTIRMHRTIVGAPEEMLTDHIDSDTLNNQRNNLRICTVNENAKNRVKNKSSKNKYKGVCYRKDNGKWRAIIQSNGKQYSLGDYNSELEAAIAYNKKAIELHGEFAKINDI